MFDDPDELFLAVRELGAHLEPAKWVVAKYSITNVHDPADETGCIIGTPKRVTFLLPLDEWLANRETANAMKRARRQARFRWPTP